MVIIIVIITNKEAQVKETRFSRQREIVLGALVGNKTHPTADAVYELARKAEPNISLGTVYRNLKVLADEGKIITLETQDKKIHYDADTSPHEHFLCDECGKIYDFFRITDGRYELENEGYSVRSAKTVYYGVCKECKNKLKTGLPDKK